MTSPAFISLEELEKSSSPRTYGPGASSGVTAPRHAAMGKQAALPALYRTMSPAELDAAIGAARARLGDRLVILGHHYQRDEIVKFADFRGDSFKLSRLAAEGDADYIVFCGVYFMAESADILSGPDQTVILPNLSAGCSMADMARLDDVLTAWEAIVATAGPSIVPVTYMNSAADLKGFCGERGGIVCTSSNAAAIVSWAYDRGRRVLFFPDEHLGRNTADQIGLSQSDVSVWDPRDPNASRAALANTRLTVWKGFCSVHERFTVDQIKKARVDYPGCIVIVHPECHRDVVQAADISGSTERIVAAIEQAQPGTVWAVGTEVNLVTRLAAEHPDKTIFCLDPIVCPCSTMYRIHPAYLAWVLDALVAGQVINQITVSPEVKRYARLALDRMLDVGSSAPPTTDRVPAAEAARA